jgi:UDP-3-O-[3-hydroxymyristoyl] glucosamine N-acyltransferase
MAKTLKEIAALIGGEIVGDESIIITGVAGIQDAAEGDITFLANPKYLPYLRITRASAVIASRDTETKAKPIIRVDNPSLAFTKTVAFILPAKEEHFKGIHQNTAIAKNAKLGKNVSIGAFVVIEDGCSVGDNTVIYPNCYLGRKCSVGADSVIYSNVSIRENCSVGNRAVIHSGAVIGSDGFGFVTVDGTHHKIPQVGTVMVEDDVEIGANVTIDRARFDKTIIGAGTKIDNLVQIAHNVRIGKNCLIVSQTGISGSAIIGDNVILAGQVGVVGHITVGENSVVMARTGINKSLPAGSMVWGTPAKPVDEAKKISACVQMLPKLFETVKEIKNKIEGLTRKNG